MMDGAPYSRSDNTTIAQELPSEIVPKTIPPEVCDDSQPLPSETVFADSNDNGLKGCKIGDMIKQAKLDGTYKDPYDGIDFVEFHPVIKDRDGNVIFDEKVIFPDYFRENDVKIVASKYLANQAKRKETDLRQMIDRVSDTITDWGIKDGYFKTEYDALQYNYKLKYYHIHQYASFNSPVYFNVGLDDSKPQTAACFILSVDDNMESITDWYAHESLLFKGGSGSGVNLSKLRSSKERVRGGGFASGPVSFLKASDTIAGVIRSGGTLRRAAKMACLNIDHPDIMKFISCKDREEKKLRLIKQAGMKPEAGAELSDDIFFQNVNLSARLSNKFMRAVKNNGVWNTTEVLTGKIVDTYDAKGLLMYLSECSWKGGEPGIQFHDNINLMNTVSDEGDIDASNPCVVGDTLLRSPEGDIKIKDLVESGRTEIPVYCCDPATGEVHIRMGRNPRKTGENRKVYKVTFSKGRGGIHSITVTDNHKFLDSDGKEIQCKDLVFEGKNKTRLMPFNKLTEKYRTAGGKETYIYNRAMKIKESHLVLNWKNGSKINFGRMSDEYCAHHIDEDHLNNHPNNLEALLNRNHNSNHSAGENNPRYGVKVSDETKKLMADVRKQNFRDNGTIYDEECEWCGTIFETSKSYVQSGKFCSQSCRIDSFNARKQARRLAWIESVKHKCPHCDTIVLSNAVTCGSDCCISKAVAKGSDYANVSYDRKQAATASTMSKALNLGASFICEGFDISTPNNWDMFLDADLDTFEGSHRVTSRTILKYWGNWSAFINAAESRNHIVMDVEYVGEEDVYNITVDEFHTVAWGEVITKNCGEWNFLNNTVCNLAAHNLLKFFSIVNGVVVFDKAAFVDVIRTITTAQDLFIDNSIYPNDKITKNAKRYRTMGYGFSNLGALFMYLGLPYDSDRAMSLASVLNSLMTGIAYQVSADLARDIGTAEWWDNKKNHESMHNVIHIHRSSTDNINDHNDELIAQIKKSCCDVWADLDDNFRPIRAASTTLSAPTGTTGFLMGCDSFGPEPFFGLITYKTLSGNDGATIKTVSDTVFLALLNLGYSEETANNIISDMTDRDIPIEKSPFVKPEHVPIFDTAVAPVNGVRAIGYMGHVNMLAAIQPFISSAISKTINMDNKCTVKDIYDIYMYSWEKGLKSITIYRDGSKTEQVLTTVETKNEIEPEHTDKPYRKRMPIDRNAKIHKFTINGNVEGYIIAGIYEDGSLGELFIEGTSFGSTLGGFTDSLSIVTSMALQHGVPLDVLVKKLMHTRFEPAGFSTNPNIRVTSSLVDYIFRYLALEFLPDDKLVELGLKHSDDINTTDLSKSSVVSGSPCPVCSSLMVRLGTCEQCLNGCYSSGSCG